MSSVRCGRNGAVRGFDRAGGVRCRCGGMAGGYDAGRGSGRPGRSATQVNGADGLRVTPSVSGVRYVTATSSASCAPARARRTTARSPPVPAPAASAPTATSSAASASRRPIRATSSASRVGIRCHLGIHDTLPPPRPGTTPSRRLGPARVRAAADARTAAGSRTVAGARAGTARVVRRTHGHGTRPHPRLRPRRARCGCCPRYRL